MTSPSPPSPSHALTAAEQLEGLTLDGGWVVERKLTAGPNATGSTFSVGYVLKRGNERAFLKALDFSLAFQSSDPALALQKLTEAFNFERQILVACRDKRLSRVVTCIHDGRVTVPNASTLPVVQYLIFELADGDVRKHLDLATSINTAWALRSLHHVAVGLSQMHNAGMAHQDLKPSNVLIFDKGAEAKIGDLGRSASRTVAAPHDVLTVAGDPNYAPPEMRYGAAPLEWNARRMGCDVYHLGSMIMFYFTRASMTPFLIARLDPSHRPGAWGSTYELVLPHVRAAYAQVMSEVTAQLSRVLVGPFDDDAAELIRALCDPDPGLRGYPRTRGGSATPLALQRAVARLDLLARRAEVSLGRTP